MKRYSIISSLLGLALVISCKAFEKSKPTAEVRERSTETLPEIDVGTKEADASAARMRPSASLGGSVAMFSAGSRFCLATQVKDNFFLTAATCVVEPLTGYPRPGFMPGVRLTLGWNEPSSPNEPTKIVERRANARTVAIYAHPSFVSHFKRPLEKGVFEDIEKLQSVADLAILAVAFEDSAPRPAVATLATGKWPETQELIALQGFCGAAAADAKQEPPSLAGGRLLQQEKSISAEGRLRSYLSDTFSNARALFDCEGFRGAPVIAENGKELLAVTSWMQPGGLQRGITRVNDDPSNPASVSGWITRTLANPPPYVAPKTTSLLSCGREVTTGIGTFKISFENWPVHFEDTPAGFLGFSDLTFDLDLKIAAPAADQVTANSAPLLPAGSTDVLQKRYRMIRDLRQPANVQFLSADKITLGKLEILVSFITTDRESSLAIVTIFDSTEKKERTVNIYFGRFDSNEFCKVDKKPEEASPSQKSKQSSGSDENTEPTLASPGPTP